MKKKYDISHDEIRDWLSENLENPPSEEDILMTEEALVHFSKAHATTPSAHLRDKILGKVSDLNRKKKHRQLIDPGNLPALSDSTNLLDWEEAVSNIEPPDEFDNIHLHTLESNEKRELFVVWVKEYVEPEVHYDLLESFLILEGSCECCITDEAGNARTVRLGTGDFITIQTGDTHNIQITSPTPVKAILEWEKLAA